jgi:hypothetical protein
VIFRNIVAIVANGTKHIAGISRGSFYTSRQSGAAQGQSKLENERAIEFHQEFKSGHTMWKWYWLWRIDE